MLLSHRKTLTRIAVVLPSWPASWSRHVARSLPSGIPSIPSIPGIPQNRIHFKKCGNAGRQREIDRKPGNELWPHLHTEESFHR